MKSPAVRSTHNRQERFVSEYPKDLNATQAAIRAGYSPKSAAAIANRLLRKVNVSTAIKTSLERATKQAQITVERTLKEISRIAFGDIRRLFDQAGHLKAIQELDEDATALIASIESEELFEGTGADRRCVSITRKIKFHDKLNAIDQAMTYLGVHKSQPTSHGSAFKFSINPSGGKGLS